MPSSECRFKCEVTIITVMQVQPPSLSVSQIQRPLAMGLGSSVSTGMVVGWQWAVETKQLQHLFWPIHAARGVEIAAAAARAGGQGGHLFIHSSAAGRRPVLPTRPCARRPRSPAGGRASRCACRKGRGQAKKFTI